MAQYIPALRKVTGQKEDQQHTDEFHGLKTEEIDLRVARPRTSPEDHQQRGEREAHQQRDEAQLAGEPLIIQPAESRQQQRPRRRALGEIHEQHVVAHRVAQAHHQDQSDSAQGKQRRKKRLVARETAQAPPDMRQPESAQKDSAPKVKGVLELSRLAHHEQRLQLAELFARQQLLVRDAAHVAQAAGEVVDLASRRVAVAQFGEERRKRGQQILARAEFVQIQQSLGGKPRIDRGKPFGLRLMHL